MKLAPTNGSGVHTTAWLGVLLLGGGALFVEGKEQPSPANPADSSDVTKTVEFTHGTAQNGLAAFLRCDRKRFKIGEPIPLTYGLLYTAKLGDYEKKTFWRPARFWSKTLSWCSITGPDGKEVPYTDAARDEIVCGPGPGKVSLSHRELIGKYLPDLRDVYKLNGPGTYKVRWNYRGGPVGNDQWLHLVSNEVQFEVVK